MKNIKRKISIFIILTVTAISFSFVLSSCQKNEDVSYLIAYTNNTNDDIEYFSYSSKDLSALDTEGIVNALITELFFVNREDGIHYSPLPKEVELNSFNIKDGELVIDFNDAYNSMTNVQDIILRASVVLTLVQVEDVESIIFTINNKPITDSEGNEIGAMHPGQYVNILLSDEELLKQETSLNIYFTDEKGKKLIPVNYQFTLDNQSQSLEEYIIRKLIQGPDDTDTYPTLDPGVELISIMTTEHTCYVNFTESFINQNLNISDEIMIYSIVDSLTDLAYINDVQILVEGESDIILHKNFDLTKPLSKRYDILN